MPDNPWIRALWVLALAGVVLGVLAIGFGHFVGLDHADPRPRVGGAATTVGTVVLLGGVASTITALVLSALAWERRT